MCVQWTDLDVIPEKQQNNFSNEHACSQAFLELQEHDHEVLRLALYLLLSIVTSINPAM